MSTIQRRNRSRAVRSRRGILPIETKQLSALTELVEMQKTEVRGFTERVLDVPRIHLKREKVYTFVRQTITGTQMVNSTVASITYAFAPSLSNFPQSAEFTNLFEQWRIIQLTWIFTPVYNGSVANPLYTWFDPDDDNQPIGTAEAAQSETLRVSASGSFVNRTFTPRLAVGSTANGSAIGGYIQAPLMTWNDDSSASNKYYGCKAVIPANTNIANAVPLYNVDVSAVLQFRRPK